jgi:methanogenic corrinoid protein MtbC1
MANSSTTSPLDALQHAIHECKTSPSFGHVVHVCMACRTAFVDFIGEYIVSGAAQRNGMLTMMLGLLRTCEKTVEKATSGLSGKRLSLAQDYLEHIRRRKHLAEVIKDRGLTAYLELIENGILKGEPAAASQAKS